MLDDRERGDDVELRDRKPGTEEIAGPDPPWKSAVRDPGSFWLDLDSVDVRPPSLQDLQKLPRKAAHVEDRGAGELLAEAGEGSFQAQCIGLINPQIIARLVLAYRIVSFGVVSGVVRSELVGIWDGQRRYEPASATPIVGVPTGSE
jgi:hypothetical protein